MVLLAHSSRLLSRMSPSNPDMTSDILSLGASGPCFSQQKAPSAHPYAPSLSSSASSSSSSVFSLDGVSSSQSSISSISSISSTSTNPVDLTWEGDSSFQHGCRYLPYPVPCDLPASRSLRSVVNGCSASKAADTTTIPPAVPPAAPTLPPAVPPELRKHPRRTNGFVTQSNGTSCLRPPPCLVHQSERKVNFVDNLVGKW